MNLAQTAEILLKHALSLPSTWEDHPWGERVAKVGTKIFLFLGRDSARGDVLSLSVKLPTSSISALDRPECEPTGYGMGKHGWVSAKYERGDTPPVDLLKSWIEESYRAVAPTKLAQALDGAGAAAAQPRVKSAKKATSAKVAKSARTATPAKAARTAKTAPVAATASTGKTPKAHAAKSKSPSPLKRRVTTALTKSRAR